MLYSKFLPAAVLLLSGIASAAPALEPATADYGILDKRDPDIDSEPKHDAICLGYTVDKKELKRALKEAVDLADKKKQVGDGKYPHEFRNDQKLPFPNCAGKSVLEFPILRPNGKEPPKGKPPGDYVPKNPWKPDSPNAKLPGRTPDRVVFAFDGKKATYCGTMTHEKQDANDADPNFDQQGFRNCNE